MSTSNNQDKPILSDRQIEVLRALSEGLSNQQIAQDLHISVNTVRVHLRNIFEKIEVQSRTEAVMWAIKTGLIEHNTDVQEVEATNGHSENGTPHETIATATEAQASPVNTYTPPAAFTTMPAIIPRLSVWQRLYFVLATIVALFFLFTPVIKSTLNTNDEGQAQVYFHDKWRVVSHMPTSRLGLSLAHINRNYYIIAGKRTSGPTGLVEIYEVDNDRWREGPGKPTPVVDVQAITINDKIYVAGGCNDEVEATDVLEILDTSTNLWTAGPPLPTPLCGYAATADAQNLYIIGGWDGNNYHDVVYMLNIDDEETMQWRILETPYPHKTGYAGAAFLAGEIYVAGGLKGDQELADVHILNLQTEEWRKGPSLQSPRAGLGLINLNDTLFAIGGGWSSNLRYNERLIAGQSEWEQLTTPYSKEWRNFGIAQNGKDIIIAGGWNGDYINLLVTYEGDFRVFIPVLQ